MPIGDFLGGLLNGFGQTSIAMQQIKQDKEERKLRAKLVEIELAKAQRQQQIDAQLQEMAQGVFQGQNDGTMGGAAIPAQNAIGTREELQQNPGVLDQIARGRIMDYRRKAAILMGDIGALSKIDEEEQARQFQEKMLAQFGGQGGPGGMVPSTTTFNAEGKPSFQFQAPEYRYIETPGGQIPYDPRNPPGVLPNQPNFQRIEVPTPGGGKAVQFIDIANQGLPSDPGQVQFGGGIPTQLGPMDTPMSADEANKYFDPQGKPAPAGITPKQAMEQGYTNQPSPNMEKLNPGDAGRVAAMDAGMKNLQTIQQNLVKDGKVNFELVAGMWANLPKSKGRKYRAQMEEAIDTAVKMKTGATANDQEMKNYLRMYMPSPLDDDATAIDKLSRLNSFLSDAREMSKSAGGTTVKPTEPKVIDFNDLP